MTLALICIFLCIIPSVFIVGVVINAVAHELQLEGLKRWAVVVEYYRDPGLVLGAGPPFIFQDRFSFTCFTRWGARTVQHRLYESWAGRPYAPYIDIVAMEQARGKK